MDSSNSKYSISSICNSSGSGSGNGLHVMMFPFLAFGHISPFLQLARKLSAADPTIHITFLSAPANVPRISSLLPSSCNSNISVISLPLPPIPGLPPGAESTADLTSSQAELLKLAVDAMKPDVHSLLSHLTPNLVIFDFAQPWIPSIAAPLGIKTLFFSVFAAISTALTVPCRRTPSAGPPTVEQLKSPPAGFPPSATSALGSGVPTYQAQDFTNIFKVFENGKPCVYDRVTSCVYDRGRPGIGGSGRDMIEILELQLDGSREEIRGTLAGADRKVMWMVGSAAESLRASCKNGLMWPGRGTSLHEAHCHCYCNCKYY